MDITSMSSYVGMSYSSTQKKTTTETAVSSQSGTSSTSSVETTESTSAAAVLESSSSSTSKAGYSKSKVDTATIERMKQEAEAKTAQLRNIVEKLIMKQSGKTTSAMDLIEAVKSGSLEVDEATQAQAAEDISEDGYWGSEQTSDRLVDFAKALAGNDPDKADEMIEAFKKGYKAAQDAWGDELPDVCKETYDKFLEKMDAWKNGTDSESEN